ncbi:O-antigen ligase family protein [Sutcliffiella horikoshii]|uniref:O-antigen ligase family protein n=1 Tax=Sutcliffiella horikoshii TaxID=79883 RepID=UPI003CF43D30
MGYFLTALKQHKEKIILIIMGLFMFLAPYSVSGIYQKLTPVPSSVLATFLATGVLFLLLLVHFKDRKQLNPLSLEQKAFLGSIYIPGILAILAAFFNLTVMLSVHYVDYITQALPNRVINLTLFLMLFYTFFKLISFLDNKVLLSITRWYLFGVLIVTAIGIWQFLHFMFGYPMIDLNTRSFVHSVESDVLFNFRLTSITDEPSYLVPFLIDALIIGLVLYASKKKYFLLVFIPCMFVLIFSFSVSGYANMALLVGFIVVIFFTTKLENKRKILKYTLYGLIPVVILMIIQWDFVLQLLQPITGRFDTLFDIHRHSRLYMLVMPIAWLFDYSWVNSIFGFGPGSYWFLAQTKFLYHQGPLSVTSNNIFIDLLFEHGVFGFLLITAMFVYVFYRLFKVRNEHKYFLYSLILWVHLAITSMYRSDFVSPRFWAIVIIIFIFVELGKRDKGMSTLSSLKSR